MRKGWVGSEFKEYFQKKIPYSSNKLKLFLNSPTLFISQKRISMKQSLQNLLREGKTRQVIQELITLTTNNADLNKEVTMLSNRSERLEYKSRNNLTDESIINIEQNHINSALLDVIEKLYPKSTPSVFDSKNAIKIGLSIAAVIAVLANITTILAYFKKPEPLIQKDTTVVVPSKQKKDSNAESSPTTVQQSRNLKDLPQPPKEPAKKYVKITLFVDDTYSNAEIFANDKAVFPLSESTLIIKYLQIEYQPIIHLKVKSGTNICPHDITIPETYFDNLNPIQKSCYK